MRLSKGRPLDSKCKTRLHHMFTCQSYKPTPINLPYLLTSCDSHMTLKKNKCISSKQRDFVLRCWTKWWRVLLATWSIVFFLNSQVNCFQDTILYMRPWHWLLTFGKFLSFLCSRTISDCSFDRRRINVKIALYFFFQFILMQGIGQQRNGKTMAFLG